MVRSCVTINVALCYIICSAPQGRPDAKTEFDLREDSRATPRTRLKVGPADHGAARPPGPALELADFVGASPSITDLPRAPHSLRRGLADGAAGAPDRAAAGGFRRTNPRGRIPPHRLGSGITGDLPAAASLRRAMAEGAELAMPEGPRWRKVCSGYHKSAIAIRPEFIAPQTRATGRLAPWARTILFRLPAGASGPLIRQTV